MRVDLCKDMHGRSPEERRAGGGDFGREPAVVLYVECQREKGHQGNHAALWMKGWMEWTPG